jgi:hypothetical protein
LHHIVETYLTDRHARGPFRSLLLLPLSRIQNKCRPPPHAPFSAPLSSHPCPCTSPPFLCSQGPAYPPQMLEPMAPLQFPLRRCRHRRLGEPLAHASFCLFKPPHHPYSLPEMQGCGRIIADHLEPPTSEHSRATIAPPPHVDPPLWGAPAPSSYLPGCTVLLASRHRAAGKRATTPSRTWTTRGDHAASAPCRGAVSWLLGWTGLLGRGPVSLSVSHTLQAALLRGL